MMDFMNEMLMGIVHEREISCVIISEGINDIGAVDEIISHLTLEECKLQQEDMRSLLMTSDADEFLVVMRALNILDARLGDPKYDLTDQINEMLSL